jgi:hypothetical protein
MLSLKLQVFLPLKVETGAIVEYFGEGATSMSCTGKEQSVIWELKLVLPLLHLDMMILWGVTCVLPIERMWQMPLSSGTFNR